jgi:hypothetical protein
LLRKGFRIHEFSRAVDALPDLVWTAIQIGSVSEGKTDDSSLGVIHASPSMDPQKSKRNP